jgi:regulator of Ty1 transposition protein 109
VGLCGRQAMTSPALPVSSLREHLLSSLSSLPGSRTFHLHTLASSPRRPTQSLFPYASPRPKCLVQDVLILLSEQVAFPRSEQATPSLQGNSETICAPRTFVCAVEACVYAFPANDSTVLYVSKVDGTGQGIFPSPTSTLVRAFLCFYASPRSPVFTMPTTHHLWIHLFARSQRQYLFPNSADHPNKKPLGDVALCKWWKNLLGHVAKNVEDTNQATRATGEDFRAMSRSESSVNIIKVHSTRLFYLLPGQSEQEVTYLLREAQASPVGWIYSHPYEMYAETGLPFPSDTHDKISPEGRGPRPLASLIPHFEDDPKSRFLDELAATSEEHAVAVPVPTPKKKRQKTRDGDESGQSTLTNNHSVIKLRTEEVGEPSTQLPPPPEIVFNPPSSSPPPYGERSPPSRPSTPKPMEFDSSALLSPHTPDLPTFPNSLALPQTPPPQPSQTASGFQTPASCRTPRTPRTPRRPKSDLDTTSPSEFWERMSYRQECAQGAVTGFFVAIFSQQCDTTTSHGEFANASQLSSHSETKSRSLDPSSADVGPPLLLQGTLPHSLIKRVMSSLLTGVEFSTTERAHKGTQVIETAIQGLCKGLGDMSSELSVKESPANDGKQATKQTGTENNQIYKAHVYASLLVSNPPLARKSSSNTGTVTSNANPPVNVLGVRRKKKRE